MTKWKRKTLGQARKQPPLCFCTSDGAMDLTFQMNTSLAAPGGLAHHLQRHTACKIQSGRQGAPKWPTGSVEVSTPRFLGILSNFH